MKFAPLFCLAALCGASSLLATRPAQAQATAPTKKNGKMIILLSPNKVKSKEHDATYAFLKQTKLLQLLVEMVYPQINLPSDLTVTMDESDEVNAYYTPAKKTITLTYGMISLMRSMKAQAEKLPPEKASSAKALGGGTVIFTFVHELGHALIDIKNIPVLGQEEDVADQLAVLLLTRDKKEEGQTAVMGATLFFGLSSNAGKPGTRIAWEDEHAIGPQRMINLLSLLYGSDPKKFAGIVGKLIPERRAAQGVEEYKRVKTAWGKYLLD